MSTNPGTIRTQSQKGQDVWVISEIFPDFMNGWFVDLAASDGVTLSNTYLLEKDFGWKGICIEPNPDFFARLIMNRDCICLKDVISDREEDVLFRTDIGVLGGIVAKDTDNGSKARPVPETAETSFMRATTLTSILDALRAPSYIHYLSLDVEGAEERVIRGLDLEKYRFGCMTVERPSPECNRMLQDAGYVFIKNFMFDTFYVHEIVVESSEGRIKPGKFEQLPRKTW